MPGLDDSTSIRKNLLYAVGAQALAFSVSVLSTLVVPKALGVEGYGYWQLFFLYSGYAGLVLLGMNDGLVLRLAGKRLAQIDRAAFKGELYLALLLQSALLAVLVISLVAMQGGSERNVVFAFVFVYGSIANITTFLSYLLQSVNLAHIQSKAIILAKVLFATLLLTLAVIGAIGYVELIVVFLASQAISLAYLVIRMRRILDARPCGWRAALRDAMVDVRSGFKVMVAYQANQLIVGFTRMMVDACWGIAVFGLLSFSTSIVSFFLAFTSQVAVVLLPSIRRLGGEGTEQAMKRLQDLLCVLLPLGYLLYFPACAFVEWWLPRYAPSMEFLSLLLPICFFDSKMDILCGTYFKALRKENFLLVANLITMAVSMAMVGWSVVVLGDVVVAVLCMVGCIAVRSVVSETVLSHLCSRKVGSSLIMEIALAACYLIFTQVIYAPAAVVAAVGVYYVVNRHAFTSCLGIVRGGERERS